MSHRYGDAFRKASARDLAVLALGVVLVITGVGLSTWGSLGDLAEICRTVDAGSPTSWVSPPGGEQT